MRLCAGEKAEKKEGPSKPIAGALGWRGAFERLLLTTGAGGRGDEIDFRKEKTTKRGKGHVCGLFFVFVGVSNGAKGAP